MNNKKDEVELQRDYYTRTADKYESMHVHGDGNHDLSCQLISALSRHYKINSILDVGSGTGRGVIALKNQLPNNKIVGIEPVEALRAVGHENGIPEEELIEGDAVNLKISDQSYDLVCTLGVLHHVPIPRNAISEMIRVSKKSIFISDNNRFGQGSIIARKAKIFLWKFGLWPTFNWIKTKGKGYTYSEGDGIAYSYSIFDDYDFICSHFEKVMLFNLSGKGKNPLVEASSIGLFAVNKKRFS